MWCTRCFCGQEFYTGSYSLDTGFVTSLKQCSTHVHTTSYIFLSHLACVMSTGQSALIGLVNPGCGTDEEPHWFPFVSYILKYSWLQNIRHLKLEILKMLIKCLSKECDSKFFFYEMHLDSSCLIYWHIHIHKVLFVPLSFGFLICNLFSS